MNGLLKQANEIIRDWQKYDKNAKLLIPAAVIFAELLLLKLKSENHLCNNT